MLMMVLSFVEEFLNYVQYEVWEFHLQYLLYITP